MDELIFDDPKGVVALEAMRSVHVGMTTDQIVASIGDPKLRLRPDELHGPTAIFHSVGLASFRFDADDDIDTVWVYVHDRRGKFKLVKLIMTCLGFRDGTMTNAWQEHRPLPT